MSRFLFLLLGALIGILSFFVSFKLAVLVIFGLAFVIFSFFYLEISIFSFVFGMCIIPHGYWNNIYIMGAAIFYLGVYMLQVMAKKRPCFDIKLLPASLILFSLVAVLSLIISKDFTDSLRLFLILISCIIISVLLYATITTKQLLNTFVTFIFFGIFLTAMYGLYQFRSGVEIRADYVDFVANAGMPGRVFSTMDNPNNYAEFLVLFLPLCVSYILNCKNDLKRLVFTILIAPCFLALVLTLSRASYIAIVVAAGIYILLLNKRLIPFCIVVLIGLIPFIPATIINRIMTIGKDTSSLYRLMIWVGALESLSHHWITGIGMGPAAFAKIYRIYVDPLAATAMHAHNLILQIWIEMGLAGIISFVVLIFTTVKSNIILCIHAVDRDLKHYLAAFAATIPAILVFSMVEYIWFYPRVMLVFWIVIGLSLCTIRLGNVKN